MAFLGSWSLVKSTPALHAHQPNPPFRMLRSPSIYIYIYIYIPERCFISSDTSERSETKSGWVWEGKPESNNGTYLPPPTTTYHLPPTSNMVAVSQWIFLAVFDVGKDLSSAMESRDAISQEKTNFFWKKFKIDPFWVKNV